MACRPRRQWRLERRRERAGAASDNSRKDNKAEGVSCEGSPPAKVALCSRLEVYYGPYVRAKGLVTILNWCYWYRPANHAKLNWSLLSQEGRAYCTHRWMWCSHMHKHSRSYCVSYPSPPSAKQWSWLVTASDGRCPSRDALSHCPDVPLLWRGTRVWFSFGLFRCHRCSQFHHKLDAQSRSLECLWTPIWEKRHRQ